MESDVEKIAQHQEIARFLSHELVWPVVQKCFGVNQHLIHAMCSFSDELLTPKGMVERRAVGWKQDGIPNVKQRAKEAFSEKLCPELGIHPPIHIGPTGNERGGYYFFCPGISLEELKNQLNKALSILPGTDAPEVTVLGPFGTSAANMLGSFVAAAGGHTAAWTEERAKIRGKKKQEEWEQKNSLIDYVDAQLHEQDNCRVLGDLRKCVNEHKLQEILLDQAETWKRLTSDVDGDLDEKVHTAKAGIQDAIDKVGTDLGGACPAFYALPLPQQEVVRQLHRLSTPNTYVSLQQIEDLWRATVAKDPANAFFRGVLRHERCQWFILPPVVSVNRQTGERRLSPTQL